ncbi:leucine-rich repeat domain-containing protein [Aquimarina algiphila]|uniref:leucine-rich repeat domain-containing protein n=1 Tax=Aquimarina algiphila TaxID=2047982 RepID=UPI002490CE83|nr:hypothetical protein [Aquimarina algiphila]
MLNLSKSKSENLFEKIKTAKDVTKLSIRYPNYDLEKYGPSFLNFGKLKSLFLQSKADSINIIPSDVGELKTLKQLEILNFSYQEFPKWILKLPNLEQLVFRGHDIESLPESISQLIKLKSFRLENCAIKKLPESMYKMKKLIHLSLADNFKLESIDTNYLPINLKELIVSPSNLSSKQKEMILKRRPNLKVIDND